jgi:hypothetical protein
MIMMGLVFNIETQVTFAVFVMIHEKDGLKNIMRDLL